jgi:signal transduction histidine kinase
MTVDGDPRLLRRMVRNLLENARRHGAGTPVEVRAWREASGPAFEVLDRGPGVPEAERERIFEPFHRLAGHGEGSGGVGLGLSLVRQIARRHGASVACLPREGGGSRFAVRFGAAR